jgi:glycosyltransferase involved in cell wall biosynthesis
MKIVLVHNFYKLRGGEDEVFENERNLLISHSHEVIDFTINNNLTDSYTFSQKLKFPLLTIFNLSIYNQFRQLLKTQNPDVVHIHNYWPLISPSVMFACNNVGIPWLQTIHNYRYLVADGLLLPKDVDPVSHKVSIRSRPWNNFRKSYILTAIYKITALFVRFSGVVQRGTGMLQVLNHFSQGVLGNVFPLERLFVRGNFLPDQASKLCNPTKAGDFFLYLGRLSGEKGLRILFDAWISAQLGITLIVAGTGPLEDELKNDYAGKSGIQFIGFASGAEKFRLLAEARALILPSVWQENFPVTIMEANFCGTPVIASRIGGLPEMIDDGITGLLFNCGSSNDLADKLIHCHNDPNSLVEMGMNARIYAERRFSEKIGYNELMKNYEIVILSAKFNNR